VLADADAREWSAADEHLEEKSFQNKIP